MTQLEMNAADIQFAERVAAELGYKQTAYNTSSDLCGLFCLPDHEKHRSGCIVKTTEFGFLFVADLDDMGLRNLEEQ